MRNSTIYNLADDLVADLLDLGFVVQRYDSFTSNSIYLKLDYGVSRTIRISDHESHKSHLKYTYNIGPHINKSSDIRFSRSQYFFREADADELLNLVMNYKQHKIQRYGIQNYKKYMKENQEDHRSDKGFWKNAYLVTRNEVA